MLRFFSAITVKPSGTQPVSQPMSLASVRFERDHVLPSNTRQQPSHMEARSMAAEVLKSKDSNLPRQMAKTPLCNRALQTWQMKLKMCFGGMLEQMLEMWPTCARNRDSI